ncbi:MAG TPA: ubiquinol oxidase subunit II [Aliidongia sp.]|nr:ubiquinol oxidase subunit II [Aliidongia sp.]
MPGAPVRPSAERLSLCHLAMRRGRTFAALLAMAPLLGGCQIALLDPKGPIGVEERSIILLATGLMLVIVLPVIAMTIGFAWRYRASNTDAAYEPDWHHSNKIEAAIWLVPCLIIAVLAYVTWVSTHTLDPYRPIASTAKPIEVDVVSLDWKWLFIYPELKVASVNELALPVGTPVNFRLTSGSVMNSFFIPQLGSQIYTMAGMETKLSLLASEAGDYEGVSANYSGGGFSDMRFTAKALSESDFNGWVEKARASSQSLTESAYRELAQPSEKTPVAYFGDVEPNVYHDALNKCADGQACMDDSMKYAMAKQALGAAALCDRSNPRGM